MYRILPPPAPVLAILSVSVSASQNKVEFSPIDFNGTEWGDLECNRRIGLLLNDCMTQQMIDNNAYKPDVHVCLVVYIVFHRCSIITVNNLNSTMTEAYHTWFSCRTGCFHHHFGCGGTYPQVQWISVLELLRDSAGGGGGGWIN